MKDEVFLNKVTVALKVNQVLFGFSKVEIQAFFRKTFQNFKNFWLETKVQDIFHQWYLGDRSIVRIYLKILKL